MLMLPLDSWARGGDRGGRTNATRTKRFSFRSAARRLASHKTRRRRRGDRATVPTTTKTKTNLPIVVLALRDDIEMRLDSSPAPSLDAVGEGGSPLAESELIDAHGSCLDYAKLGVDATIPPSGGRGDFEIGRRLPVSEKDHSSACKDAYSLVPRSAPEKWPQRPILMCPSPESGVRIRGIRHSSSKSYLPLPGTGFCNGCILPINNGLEKRGERLVIEFESDLFVGTAMLWIKNASDPLGPQRENGDSDPAEPERPSYFRNNKRTFQARVRGRFKVPGVPMSECVTGQAFHRPAGRLPPRIVTRSAVALGSRLAPQLQARLDGDRPHLLSPLASAAQISVSRPTDKAVYCDGADEGTEAGMNGPQPSDLSSSIHNLADDAYGTSPDSAVARIKTRKREFDELHARRSEAPAFDPNLEYTFEFFQHVLRFDELALHFPAPVGKLPLRGMLNGQPLKFMAAHQICERDENGALVGEKMRWLWSFDLWHESLYRDAKCHGRE